VGQQAAASAATKAIVVLCVSFSNCCFFCTRWYAVLAALAADVGVNVNSRGGTGAAASLRARNSGDGKCRPCVTSLGQSKSIGAYKIAGVEYLNNEKNFRAIAKTKAESGLIATESGYASNEVHACIPCALATWDLPDSCDDQFPHRWSAISGILGAPCCDSLSI
jgi:hypothetical protein